MKKLFLLPLMVLSLAISFTLPLAGDQSKSKDKAEAKKKAPSSSKKTDKKEKKEGKKKKEKKAKATISIQTTPGKAEIYSGGKLLGVTPSKIEIPAGDFKIFIFKDDYIIKVLEGKLKEDERRAFQVKLTPDIEIPEGLNLKYAPKYVDNGKNAFRLIQRVIIYLSHFHVGVPKEEELLLGAMRTILDGLNKIKKRQALLRQELSEKDRKAFYVEDIDLSTYPPIEWKEEKKKSKIKLTAKIPGQTLEHTFNPSNLSSCLMAYQKLADFVQKDYDKGDKISENALFFMSLQGMLGRLEDQHTRLIPPQDLKEMDMEVKGQFGGLGIVISVVRGFLTVISPIDGSPAMEKGIIEEDKIIKIEGKSTQNMSLREAVKQLRGKPGTKVTITIQRGAMQKDITLTRAIIKIKYVKSTMVSQDIGLVRISSFMGRTLPQQLAKALKKLEKKGAKAIIIDLRNNPGGLLDNAQKVASFFYKKGLVVYTKARDSSYNEKLYVDKDTKHYSKMPLAVLVNKGSASASEIVAGALQDHKRATLIGEKTYGKGSVQKVFPVPDFKTAFAITIAKYYLPKGRCIDKVGVTPDHVIKHSLITKLKIRSRSIYNSAKEDEINDLHLKKAKEILRAKIAGEKKKDEAKKVGAK